MESERSHLLGIKGSSREVCSRFKKISMRAEHQMNETRVRLRFENEIKRVSEGG